MRHRWLVLLPLVVAFAAAPAAAVQQPSAPAEPEGTGGVPVWQLVVLLAVAALGAVVAFRRKGSKWQVDEQGPSDL